MFKFISRFFLSNLNDKKGWQNQVPISSAIESPTKLLSPEQSLQVSTVWACIDLLSRIFASLPCDVYSEASDGSFDVDTKCSLHRLLSISPNSYQTPFEFWQTMTLFWALRGNAYALIIRNSDGSARALYPLNSDQMTVFINEKGQVVYQYYDRNDRYVEYSAKDIFHWKCLGNGVIGLSKLEYMRSSLTECSQTQNIAIDTYASKGRMNGILSSQVTNINPKQQQDIQAAMLKAKQGGIPILPLGFSFQQLSLTPAETQLLETRKFTVEEICRWFAVPSAMINAAGGASGANIEQVVDNFYKTTILPMCTAVEQGIVKRIACIDEKLRHRVKFRLSALNKANDQVRSSVNATALQNGWKTRNEVRVSEGLPPIPGADALTAQNNLVPLENLGKVDSSQTSQKQIPEQIKQ